jgi:hypothetical protein
VRCYLDDPAYHLILFAQFSMEILMVAAVLAQLMLADQLASVD